MKYQLKMKKEKLTFYHIVIMIFAVLFISGISPAQSVDSLINEAIANNPQLKSLQLKIKSSEYRSESINYLPPPVLSVEFSQVPINEYNIVNQSTSNNIAVSQMFPIGGKLSAMSEVEKKNTLIEEDNFEIYKINLIAQTKMAYFKLWLIDRKIDIQKDNTSLLKDFARSIEVSFYANKINQADLLSIQSEIVSNDAQLLILEKQRDAAIYNLNKLLGRDLNSKGVFAEENFVVDTLLLNQTQLEKILTVSNPSLLKMNNMIDMNKTMITANNKELIPDLMIQGMLMRMPKGMVLTASSDLFMLEPKTEIMYSLMFSINLPFAPWSIGKLTNKEEELVAGISSIEQEKNNMQREMYAQLNEAFVKYNTSNELNDLYQNKVIPLFTDAVKSQSIAYQNGQSSINTVLDSYRMLLMQKMNYYMSKADTQMSIAEIEMMVGSNLKNILLSERNY